MCLETLFATFTDALFTLNIQITYLQMFVKILYRHAYLTLFDWNETINQKYFGISLQNDKSVLTKNG